jgi:hypothetical protein
LAWWNTPVNPTLGEQGQKDHEFKANMGYMGKPCLKNKKKGKGKGKEKKKERGKEKEKRKDKTRQMMSYTSRQKDFGYRLA